MSTSIQQQVERCAFADLTDEQLTFIERLVVDGPTIDAGCVERVTVALGLEGMGVKGLTAIRNSVVRHLSDLASVARMCGNAKSHDHYLRTMSAVTAVIDHHLYVAVL